MIWQKVLMNIKSRLSKPALKHWSFFSPKFNPNRTEVPKNCYCAIFERRCSKCDQFFFKLNCQQIILLSKSRSYSRVHKSSDSFFSKILEKPSIVQKKMIPHIKGLDFSQR